MTKEPTIQDVLEAVSGLSSNIDERFGVIDGRFEEVIGAISEFSTRVDERFDSMEHRLGSVESDVGTLKSDVGTLKSKITSIETQMVTKDYLDNRLDALRGDLVALTRKLNVKLSVLVERLVKEGSMKQKVQD